MTVVSFVVVGVGPRTIGRQHAYAVGRFAAPLVHWLGRALGPLATLLIRIGNAVTPGRGFREGPFATQVELRELVDLAEQRGVVEHDERDMIHSVFALGDTIAREVMVPRTEMVWIEENKSASQALTLALRSGFSRLPVIGENVDDVLGVVYLKDLVRRSQTGAADAEVGAVMRPATLRARVQARRRPAAGDAGGPHPHGDRGRRVRRHGRPGDHRGHPRGDRRRDHRRVRRGASAGRAARRATGSGSAPGCRSRTSASSSTSSWRPTTWRRWPACSPRRWAGCRSRVRSATVGELRLEAEGTTGRRNRIDTVLVSRPGRDAVQPRGEADRRCLSRPLGRRGRQAGHAGPRRPGPGRRHRGRRRPGPGRPHVRRRHRRPCRR